ncbi:protein FAM107B isoform X1 [Rhinatrema bivittatum]|uniref:protein FAM107B isoform X1 n=2 Tax=Rhinatrema bivittatum TaxID=194408 RepID=UPI00112B0AF8|nr:protein FAM107B isoform X1 [Rhinatrema bivittatum]
MHPSPCSALLTCFGHDRESAPLEQSLGSSLAAQVQKVDCVSAVCVQPAAKANNLERVQLGQAGEEKHVERNGATNSITSNHIVPGSDASSAGLANAPDYDRSTVHTHIPRPSIIAVPKERPEDEEEEEALKDAVRPASDDEPLSDNAEVEPHLTVSSIMAEPDYIEADNPELIRPKKMVNPVKTSRNHQDLHRELLMNQKRGLAPQNKPELQKVMEKRKRDQVIKQQKEEEAQKKKSDLEIELQKRQQKLEQLELDKQKTEEEQENAPEFVKVKGNLRRTNQEATEAGDS